MVFSLFKIVTKISPNVLYRLKSKPWSICKMAFKKNEKGFKQRKKDKNLKTGHKMHNISQCTDSNLFLAGLYEQETKLYRIENLY
ncbi:MAG: hypothetical protein A3J80_03750 [Desulfobacula sp. RIFOXYB2_FULL_45_6]|nr:MAG: hypothetical protein A3J80_03750 [Desulfobacula sp. RIFOXYB2_FULL_45_6]